MNSMNENDCDFSKTPIRALSLSTRHQLSQYLNGEQYITTNNNLCRDYRGLAELMGFSYATINTLRTNDPMKSLLEMYENRSDATFELLIQMIEKIERFDIIDDLTPVLNKDAKHYLNNKLMKQSSVETTNKSISPVICDPVVIYDAYVCYSDKDMAFVDELSKRLESPDIGLRLFIRDRDMCLGSWVYESFAQIVDTQCSKVIIIFSPEFLECPECRFQTDFTTGLAIEQRNRKLIPIVYKTCELPAIVRMLTKINMTSGIQSPYAFTRLINSIRNNVINNAIVYRQSSGYSSLPECASLPSNESQLISIETINSSVISLPNDCPKPTAPPLVSTQSSISSSIISEISDLKENSESLPILSSEKVSNPRKLNHWIKSFKQKLKF